MSERRNFEYYTKPLGLDRDAMRLARRVYRHLPQDARQPVTKDGLIGALFDTKRDKQDAEKLLQQMQDLGIVECKENGRLRRLKQKVKLVEEDLYDPMKSEIETVWATQPGHNYYPSPQRFLRVFVNTGGDGPWERPDLTLIGGKTLPFIPGKFLDVTTFEVKFSEHALMGLYEALAHRRRATHSYLVFFPPNSPEDKKNKPKGPVPWVTWTKDLPEPWNPEKEPENRRILRRILDEAVRSNLGVIFARQEDDCSTWEELVRPIRHSPDPELLHDFVLSLIGPKERYEERSVLRDWLEASSFGDLTASQLDALELGPELRGMAKELYREIPSKSEMEKGLTCPEVPTLARRLSVSGEDAEKIFGALQAAGHVVTKSGRGRNGVFRTGR